VKYFVLLKEEVGPSFTEALDSALQDANEKTETDDEWPAISAPMFHMDDVDLGPQEVQTRVYKAGENTHLKYRIAGLMHRNTREDDTVNSVTNEFFNGKIAPRTRARWIEIELQLHESIHFIRILRFPTKMNHVMAYPFFASSPNSSGSDFRKKTYEVFVNYAPYAIKTGWVQRGTTVARLSEVDAMVEALQLIPQRIGANQGYRRLDEDSLITESMKDGGELKDFMRVYYSIQDESFGQWTVWFVAYLGQIFGVQLYYPSPTMLLTNKPQTARAAFTPHGFPYRGKGDMPRAYISPFSNSKTWPRIDVNVRSRWKEMLPINGLYYPVNDPVLGYMWLNSNDSNVRLGTVQYAPETGDVSFAPTYNNGTLEYVKVWAFYKFEGPMLAYKFIDTPLRHLGGWNNFSQRPFRNLVHIDIVPETLPLAVGKQNAKALAPHGEPEVHLAAVMESLGDIRRALNQTALLQRPMVQAGVQGAGPALERMA
jgi:hypothetical protein